MKYIISGTNRPGSTTLKICRLIQGLYQEAGEAVEIIDLLDLEFQSLTGAHNGNELPPKFAEAVKKINLADGLIMVVPEYNGSMPGVLKYFIDHWKYPHSFEQRPVCFVGLGGIFGGLRPVEHLMQVFSYRNGFIFPLRVFLMNVWTIFKDGELKEPVSLQLLKAQVIGFQKFCTALKAVELDANSLNAKRP
jgi:chromate reductase, NAD(P)H dehydrogenase (quinone)